MRYVTAYVTGVVSTAVSAGYGHFSLTCFVLGIFSTVIVVLWQAERIMPILARINAPGAARRKVQGSGRFKVPAEYSALSEDDAIEAQWKQYQRIPRYQRQKSEKAAWANVMDARREALTRKMSDSDWESLKPGDKNYDLLMDV